MSYIRIIKNKNQVQFDTLTSGIKINKNIKDVTHCFNPDNLKQFPGVYGMHSYMNAVNKNNNSFNRTSKITQEIQNGGMIVLSSDINVVNEDDDASYSGTTYQRTFGESYISNTIDNYIQETGLDGVGHTIGKDFSGRYVSDGLIFDENSFTVDIAGVTSDVLMDIAADLAHNFQQKEVLVRDFNENKTYLVNGIR